jgi:Arf-GAP/coiled-coil/ANK repeat/PH domain-containing protein
MEAKIYPSVSYIILSYIEFFMVQLLQYADKEFVRRYSIDEIHVAQQMWDNVTVNDKKGVYSLIVASHANVNLIYGQMASGLFLNLGKALLQEQPASPPDGSPRFFDCNSQEKVSPKEPHSPPSTSSHVDDMDDRYEGFSLLHLACRVADVGMVELLLQYGASVNVSDSRGRTPLHHCILRGRHLHAKLLLSRYVHAYYLKHLVLFHIFGLSILVMI